MSRWNWAWKALVAGLCGSAAHTALMYFKTRSGLLPTFRPYETLQWTLGQWTGSDVHPAVPWLLSWLNGSVLLGFVFARICHIPGGNGLTKGLVYGLFGWLIMGLVFFPLLGLGLFAANVGLGIAPALFSLAMFMTYSVVLGSVYEALETA
jgi:hypothetical protein